MSTLTERYVAQTVKRIPPGAQSDVRAELEASISDAIDARTEQGEPRESAERAVINELGDPGALAAGYADRPLQLIGPRYYLAWLRLLKLLLSIVPACAAGGVAIAKVLEFATVGELVSSIVLTAMMAILHVAFWTTLVFAILERTVGDPGIEWDVDELPEPAEHGAGRSELIASLLFLALAAGAILWDALRGFVRVDGEALPILAPALWPWWMAALLVIMIAEVLLAIAIYVARRWTVGFAILNTVLAIAFAVPATYLLVTGGLVNPAFLDFLASDHTTELANADAGAAEQGGVFRVVTVILSAVIVGIAVWDIIDGWLKTHRQRITVG